MTKWRIREFSKLTHISVQTLHYYDRKALLKPSLRLKNGYRLYSEKDLSKLQQIISLKFFGFELSQIEFLLSADVDVRENFAVQSQLLEEKAKSLLEASHTLKRVIAECCQDKPVKSETIIQLIEVYQRTQELEKTWIGKVLNQEELKLYASFEQSLKARFTETEIAQLEKDRAELMDLIDANLDKDPASDLGFSLAKRGMDWSHSYYGKKYVHLQIILWRKGYASEYLNRIKRDNNNPINKKLSKENVAWFDKAIEHYYITRILQVLDPIEKQSKESIRRHWEELLTELYGTDLCLKKGLFDIIMNDNRFSQTAKSWLKKISSL